MRSMVIAMSPVVRPGTVALFEGARLVYAGPIAQAPPADGKQVLINPKDHDEFKRAFLD